MLAARAAANDIVEALLAAGADAEATDLVVCFQRVLGHHLYDILRNIAARTNSTHACVGRGAPSVRCARRAGWALGNHGSCAGPSPASCTPGLRLMYRTKCVPLRLCMRTNGGVTRLYDSVAAPR